MLASKTNSNSEKNFKGFSKKKFIEDVNRLSWWGSVYSEENLVKASESWEKEFITVLDENCPVKLVEIRKSYTPWLTKEIKMKKR